MKCSCCKSRKRFSQRKPVKIVLSLKVVWPSQINLGRPPCSGAVFEFGPEGMELIADALRAEG